MTRYAFWAFLVLALVATAAFSLAGLSYREGTRNSAEQRRDLCEQIQRIKRSERQLWLRVIARSPSADPDAVEQFKKDLFELFPPGSCS